MKGNYAIMPTDKHRAVKINAGMKEGRGSGIGSRDAGQVVVREGVRSSGMTIN